MITLLQCTGMVFLVNYLIISCLLICNRQQLTTKPSPEAANYGISLFVVQ